MTPKSLTCVFKWVIVPYTDMGGSMKRRKGERFWAVNTQVSMGHQWRCPVD